MEEQTLILTLNYKKMKVKEVINKTVIEREKVDKGTLMISYDRHTIVISSASTTTGLYFSGLTIQCKKHGGGHYSKYWLKSDFTPMVGEVTISN